MFSETFFPMAEADSVPRIVHKYHHEHLPPPSDSIELSAELLRGLRAVPHGGFWSKVKSVGWRLFLKFDSQFDQPLRRSAFPVAPPSSPVPRARKIFPDIHIHPAGCPDYLLSPPRSQEDPFLYVPPRTFRAPRRRRHERLPPSPRPLPTPPGPPVGPLPKITCCSPSTPSSSSSSFSSASSSSSSSVNSDKDSEDLDCAFFLVKVAPFLFFPDEEDSPDHDDQKPQGLDAPPPVITESSNIVSQVPQNDVVTSTSPQTEQIRHAAADRHFLEELGLTPQAFMALLDGNGIEWDEDDEDDDDDESEDGDGDEFEEGDEDQN